MMRFKISSYKSKTFHNIELINFMFIVQNMGFDVWNGCFFRIKSV